MIGKIISAVTVHGLVFALLLAGLFGGYTWQHRQAQGWKEKYNELVLQATENRADLEKSFRDTERRREQQKELAEQERNDERTALQTAIKALNDGLAAAARTADGLRVQIARYSAGPRDPATDSLPACRQRAATLGQLLAEGEERLRQCERVAAELAGDAEGLATDVRTLRRAWPTDAPNRLPATVAGSGDAAAP